MPMLSCMPVGSSTSRAAGKAAAIPATHFAFAAGSSTSSSAVAPAPQLRVSQEVSCSQAPASRDPAPCGRPARSICSAGRGRGQPRDGRGVELAQAQVARLLRAAKRAAPATVLHAHRQKRCRRATSCNFPFNSHAPRCFLQMPLDLAKQPAPQALANPSPATYAPHHQLHPRNSVRLTKRQ